MTYCLIVDDSKIARKFSARILTDLGIEIGEAENGQIALEKCKERKPDVILLDWNMPVMNGFEFAQAFREIDEYKGIVVIFCTTENEISKIQQAVQAGANEYIMKPYDSEILKDKLVQTGIL